MSNKNELDVLMEGIWYMRVTFERLNLEPPSEIILKSRDEGMRLLVLVGRHNHTWVAGPNGTCNPVEHPNGSVWMEFDLMGIKFRFPANQYAVENGSYVWG